MQTTEEINSEYLQAKDAEANFYRLMTGAIFNAGSYLSPTDSDIAEAGEDWKQGGVRYFLETCDYHDTKTEESNPTKKAVDEFAGIMKNLGGEFVMAVDPNTGTPEDEKALSEYYASINTKVDSQDTGLFDDLCGMIGVLPTMEVEELEVINIELSDYPLPENVTSYDWWWA